MNHLIKKIAPIVFLLCSSQFSHAITGVVPDSTIMNINCSATLSKCFGSFNITDQVFKLQVPVCNVPNPLGGCSSSSNPDGYSINQTELFNQYLAGMNSLAPDLNFQYYGPFENCTALGDGSTKCQAAEMNKKFDSSGNPYWQKILTSWVQTNVQYNAAPCPSSGSYIAGMGCTTNSGANRTERNVSSLESNCDNDCVKKNLNKGIKPKIGNPISINSTSKVEVKQDLSFPISFTRNYDSNRAVLSTMGNGWKHIYDKKLTITQAPVSGVGQGTYTATLVFKQENDEEIIFTRLNATAPFLPAFKDLGGFSVTISGTNYILNTPSANKETYDSTGKLVSMSMRNGYLLTFAYTGSNLTTITDSYAHTLTLTYTGSLLTKVLADNTDKVDYVYTSNNLTSAAFNTSEITQYGYTTNKLTSITDPNNKLLSMFSYDSQGRALQTKTLSAASTYIHQYDMDYSSASSYIYKATQPNGNNLNYTIDHINSKKSVGNANITGGSYNNSYGFTYDSNGFPYRYTDSKYNDTFFTYYSNGLLNTLKRADGNITTYTWNTTTRLLTSSSQPTSSGTRVINYQYDTNGNMLQKSVQSIVGGVTTTRNWDYTYTTFGRMLTSTSPNASVTTYEYYADNDATVSKRGLLKKIKNHLNQTVEFTTYDTRGNPTTIVDANSISKTLTYDNRGRVLTETVGTATNSYVYDTAGDLQTATFSNGLILTFTYDQAHRLTGLSDNNGNSLSYVLDPNTDQPTNISVYKNSVLDHVKNQVFDQLGRLNKVYRSNVNEYSQYGYDGNNNITSDRNTNGYSNYLSYNSLDQLYYASGRDGTQDFTYDLDGNLKTATLNYQTTTSTYNDFGELTQLISPESGTHNYVYNVTAKTVTETDSQGIVHTSTFDALGRVTQVAHAKTGSTTQTETYVYDTATNGKGLPASSTSSSATLTYEYDTLSRVKKKTQAVGSISKIVQYGYDASNQLTTLTYPSGLIVNYVYTKGLITSITLGGTMTGTLLSSGVYKPFESSNPKSWTWGNSSTVLKQFNTDEKLTSLNSSGLINQGFGIDGEGNVLTITDSVSATKSSVSTYDNNDKISTFTQNSQLFNTYYNNSYNRTTSSNSIGGTQNISYTYTGNRLTSYSLNSVSSSLGYDNNGNMTSEGTTTYGYDFRNNLNTATKSGITTTYGFNAAGERVKKTASGSSNYFIYDESGNLLGEYDNAGNTIIEHIYLNNLPVGAIKSGTIYYVHTDQIGTPRVITTTANTIVWKWDNTDPFGKNLPSVTTLTYNKRFAGQYFDNETNLHYNYYRTYNPLLGRYLQPDPIGLAGGFNLYNYVGSNPLGLSDPYGLWAFKDGLPNGLIDATAAFGDNLIDIVSLGGASGKNIRNTFGIESVDICSNYYAVSDKISFAAGMFVPLPGKKVEVAYSVVYEMKLAPQFIKSPRPTHFKEANRDLRTAMDQDKNLESIMNKLGVNLNWGARNGITNRPPTNFTWHHEIESGTMRLVPLEQHTSGSSFWRTLHPSPGAAGGYSIWGK